MVTVHGGLMLCGTGVSPVNFHRRDAGATGKFVFFKYILQNPVNSYEG